VDLSCSAAPCQCSYDTVGLQLAGLVTVVSKDAEGTPITSTQATFGSGSSVQITVLQSNAQCIPVAYTMTVLGNVAFATDGNSFEAMFNPYTLRVDPISGSNLVEVSGLITSSCFGGMVRLSTIMPLLIPGTDPCPAAGIITIESAGGTDTLEFANGQVEIDLGSDFIVDDTLSTCLASSQFMCPAG